MRVQDVVGGVGVESDSSILTHSTVKLEMKMQELCIIHLYKN